MDGLELTADGCHEDRAGVDGCEALAAECIGFQLPFRGLLCCPRNNDAVVAHVRLAVCAIAAAYRALQMYVFL